MESLWWWGVDREEVQVLLMRWRVVGCDYGVGEMKKKDGYGVLKRKVRKFCRCCAVCVYVTTHPRDRRRGNPTEPVLGAGWVGRGEG